MKNLNIKFLVAIFRRKSMDLGLDVSTFTSNEIILSRNLLDYGLKQNVDNIEKMFTLQNYMKTQLLNSRFIINKKFQLDINLAICSFL